MAEISALGAAIHVAVFAALLVPLVILVKTSQRMKGRFTDVFMLVIAGLVPMTAYHLLRAIEYFGIDTLPPEGSAFIRVVEPIVEILGIMAFGGYMYWFYREYAFTFCYFERVEKMLKKKKKK